MLQGRQIWMHTSSPVVWFRRSAAMVGVLGVAVALLVVHFYVDQLPITVIAAALGICLLYAAFGSFKLEELIEAIAFGVALIALLVLGLLALAWGQEIWAIVAFACMIPIGLGIFKLASQNIPPAPGRRSAFTRADNTLARRRSDRAPRH